MASLSTTINWTLQYYLSYKFMSRDILKQIHFSMYHLVKEKLINYNIILLICWILCIY